LPLSATGNRRESFSSARGLFGSWVLAACVLGGCVLGDCVLGDRVLGGVAAAEESAPDGGKLTFGRNVLPILEKHCLKCHGEGAKKADLDLRSVQGALKGGESGEPAVVPGQAEKSPLL